MATQQTYPDGTTVNYVSRVHTGRGKIIETYKRKTGMWVIVHDRSRNVSVTLRLSQIKPSRAKS